MIPKLMNAGKNPVTPSSWKPSTDTSVSPTTSDFTPAETSAKSSNSNLQAADDVEATRMEETTESSTSREEGKAPEPDASNVKEEASPPQPEGPVTPKEPSSKSSKAKRSTCKKHAKESKKKKAKKHSKAVEADSSSDSEDSSSESSTSTSSDDSSGSSSEEDEAAKKKRKSKAKKKAKAKKRAKAKAKAEDTDSDSDDESSSDEEEKKKNKRRKQLKKKKRAKKSKEVEEDDDEEDEDDEDDDGNAAINRQLAQQVAQLQAMQLKRSARGRGATGNSGEIVNAAGELGKKNAKAKGKPGKRLVFFAVHSASSSANVNHSSCPSQT